MLTIPTVILWIVVFAWVVSLVLTIYGLSRQSPLMQTGLSCLTSRDFPLISILVPARNEEHRVLESCIHSILAQDYPRFEVIAVDDRSTDATGEILESIAKTDERLRVIQGAELPSGWLGKPYAMQQTLSQARGEWILATDADMIFEPSALRTAMEHTLEEEGDAITLIPHFEAKSFWERIMIPTWAWVFLMFTVFYRVRNPRSRGAVGIGGFILLQRCVLERVGGYEALKDEVMEDVRLAEMIKNSGARLLMEHAPNLASTRMYSTFREMWECSTKNWFSGVKYSLPFALFCVVSMYSISVLPVFIALASAIALAAGASAEPGRLLIPAALAWGLQILVLALVSVRSRVSPLYAFTAPLSLGLIYAMLFDSSIRITTGKGVTWKGRRIYERTGVRPPRSRTKAYVPNAEK